jgi:hypothetical protein
MERNKQIFISPLHKCSKVAEGDCRRRPFPASGIEKTSKDDRKYFVVLFLEQMVMQI